MANREATVDGVEAIQRVARESWTRDYPDVLSRESMEKCLDDWYSEERIRDSIVWSRALMLVADRDDEVVGFAHATWAANADEGNILRVYVEPHARGEGIGGRLLEENEPGKAFYEESGFAKAETDTVPIGEDTYEERTYVLEFVVEHRYEHLCQDCKVLLSVNRRSTKRVGFEPTVPLT